MPSKNLTPQEWIDEIDKGLEYRRRFGVEDAWGKMEAIYYNVHQSMTNDGPNIFLSTGDTLLSTVSVPTPQVIVKPRIPEAVAKSKIVEGLDNTLMTELRLSEEMERASLFAYLFGKGFLKAGYDSEYGYDPTLDIAGAQPVGLTLTQLDRKGQKRIEYDYQVVPGMPWVKAVCPHDIVVPWGTIKIDNCPWIAHRICRRTTELKADPKYKNTQRLVPQFSMEDFIESYQKPLSSAKRTSTRYQEFTIFYEIHDRRTGKIFCVVDGHSSFIREDDDALLIENRLPFVDVTFTPMGRSFWVTPDAYYLLYAQTELSDIARQRTKQRRLSVLKFLYDEGVISDEELQKILSPDVGAAAKIESGGDLSKAVLALNNQGVNQGLELEEEHIRRNVREQIGFSRNQLGEFTGGRRTASEAQIVDRYSQLRMSRRGIQVKRAYEKIIEVINGIVFEHWTAPRLIPVIGPQRTTEFLTVNGPSMKSRYAYSVEFTDDQEADARKMQALQMYQLLSQDPAIDPIALREFLANEVNDPAFERLFNADLRARLSQLRMQEGTTSKAQRGSAPALPGGNGQINFNGSAGRRF